MMSVCTIYFSCLAKVEKHAAKLEVERLAEMHRLEQMLSSDSEDEGESICSETVDLTVDETRKVTASRSDN